MQVEPMRSTGVGVEVVVVVVVENMVAMEAVRRDLCTGRSMHSDCAQVQVRFPLSC
jgi:hypothetical protein